jgi:adenosyl cobinamide kinase/adenosyl cobinamide phosphate guanylyltransferase
MSLVFLLGGARSGKSALAVELARAEGGPVTLIATAEARDAEMAERIALHRAERPVEWTTVEETLGLDAAIRAVPEQDVLVVDCLSLWVANMLERANVEELARTAAESARRRATLTVAVSNEVGLGVVPPTELGRHYRDVLGRVNAIWADAAERVSFVIAGRALPL